MTRVGRTLVVWVAAASACGGTQVIEHEVPDLLAQAIDRGESFPDPAMQLCGPLPSLSPSIAGLTAAWVIHDGSVLEIRLSDAPFACEESFAAERSDAQCRESWGVGIALAPSAQVPGSYGLVEGVGTQLELASSTTGKPCGADDGEIGVEKGSPELRIHAISPACVTGELSGFPASLAVDGEFHALRCD